MIRFVHQGKEQTLAPGQSFTASRETGYRDTATSDLLSVVGEIEGGRPWRQVVHDRYAAAKPWLYRIITDPCRTAFFDSVLPPGDGLVLDLGAGWGQTARLLAARRPVVALEPVAERLGFIRAAACQDGVDGNLCCLGADFFDIQFKTGFSVVCAIGVLEWAGAFQEQADPQERQRAFLRKVRSELAAGGSLVLAIENRLGLKYLLGCPDDHIGVPHIACLPAPLAVQRYQEANQHTLRSFTYSLVELQQMLCTAGFTQIDFFGAFPDYKLPEKIISLAGDGRDLNVWLAGAPAPSEHNGYDGTPLGSAFQGFLAGQYRLLAAKGIAHHFVPSFFVRAG